MVNQQVVTQAPFSQSGLAIYWMQELHDTLLLKLGWDIISNTNYLPVQALRHKYDGPHAILPNFIRRGDKSWL